MPLGSAPMSTLSTFASRKRNVRSRGSKRKPKLRPMLPAKVLPTSRSRAVNGITVATRSASGNMRRLGVAAVSSNTSSTCLRIGNCVASFCSNSS